MSKEAGVGKKRTGLGGDEFSDAKVDLRTLTPGPDLQTLVGSASPARGSWSRCYVVGRVFGTIIRLLRRCSLGGRSGESGPSEPPVDSHPHDRFTWRDLPCDQLLEYRFRYLGRVSGSKGTGADFVVSISGADLRLPAVATSPNGDDQCAERVRIVCAAAGWILTVAYAAARDRLLFKVLAAPAPSGRPLSLGWFVLGRDVDSSRGSMTAGRVIDAVLTTGFCAVNRADGSQ